MVSPPVALVSYGPDDPRLLALRSETPVFLEVVVRRDNCTPRHDPDEPDHAVEHSVDEQASVLGLARSAHTSIKLGLVTYAMSP